MKTINVSHRELRFTLGRLLHVAGLPSGCVYPVRDCLLDAQSVGIDALAALDRTLPALPGRLGQVTVVDSAPGRLTIDCLGQPSYLVAPAIVEALAVTAGPLTVEAINVLEPALIAGITATAYLYGLAVSMDAPFVCHGMPPAGGERGAAEVEHGPGTAVLTVTQSDDRPSDVASPNALGDAARRLLADGAEIEPELWWRMYELSNEALTPDSDSSRHHAGASLLDQGGKIIGEVGEDDDYVQAAGLPISS